MEGYQTCFDLFGYLLFECSTLSSSSRVFDACKSRLKEKDDEIKQQLQCGVCQVCVMCLLLVLLCNCCIDLARRSRLAVKCVAFNTLLLNQLFVFRTLQRAWRSSVATRCDASKGKFIGNITYLLKSPDSSIFNLSKLCNLAYYCLGQL